MLLLPHTWSKIPYVAQPSTMVGLALQNKTPTALELETRVVHHHLFSVHSNIQVGNHLHHACKLDDLAYQLHSLPSHI